MHRERKKLTLCRDARFVCTASYLEGESNVTTSFKTTFSFLVSTKQDGGWKYEVARSRPARDSGMANHENLIGQ